MKKSVLLQMLKDAKENPELLDDAISQLGTSRGMKFETVEQDTELVTGYWYTVQDGNLVSVPSSKIRESGKEKGKTAEFVPYYRTV